MLLFNTEDISEISDDKERLSYGVGVEILLLYDEIEGVNSRHLYFLFIRFLCRRLKINFLCVNEILK